MIIDKTSGWVEPTIIINGVELTFAQAMSVRVAVSSFLMFVSEADNRKAIGYELAHGYRDNLIAAEVLMHKDNR